MHAKEYFEPSPQQGEINKAALIVALVNDRESPARADFAHPRINDIVAILRQVRDGAGPADARPAGVAPQPSKSTERTVSSGSTTPAK